MSLEAAALIGLTVWSASQPAVVREIPIPLTFELPADKPSVPAEQTPPSKPQLPDPVPIRRQPVTRAEPPAPSPPVATGDSPPSVAATVEPAPVANAPLATSEPPRLPVPNRVSPAATEDVAAAYNARLAAAVQAAFEVPLAASSLGFKGRSRVEFTLRDGVLGTVRLVQGSGLTAVDRAALRAVSAAAFPAPPPALQGREAIYQIWVACF